MPTMRIDRGSILMEAWALRAMERWPNVPALFGWLKLTRRGQWLIRDELITRSQIIETINRNYEADSHGRWFFQNGPQRGYIELESAPLIAHAEGNRLIAHTGLVLHRIEAGFLDEEGALMFATEHGPAALLDTDLDWASSRLRIDGRALDEEGLIDTLTLPSGHETRLMLELEQGLVPIRRLNFADAPLRLGYVRVPVPRAGEAASNRESD